MIDLYDGKSPDLNAFKINDIIEARHMVKWYSGRIKLVDGRGSYSIRYADSDESKCTCEFIRLVKVAPNRTIKDMKALQRQARHLVGDRVEANFKEKEDLSVKLCTVVMVGVM